MFGNSFWPINPETLQAEDLEMQQNAGSEAVGFRLLWCHPANSLLSTVLKKSPIMLLKATITLRIAKYLWCVIKSLPDLEELTRQQSLIDKKKNAQPRNVATSLQLEMKECDDLSWHWLICTESQFLLCAGRPLWHRLAKLRSGWQGFAGNQQISI